jgi:hypothetical protein
VQGVQASVDAPLLQEKGVIDWVLVFDGKGVYGRYKGEGLYWGGPFFPHLNILGY